MLELQDLAHGGEQNLGEGGSALPVPFWRVSLGALSSPQSDDAEVSRGDP
jgi:hypothetical protein